jgi:hypothetical protein
LFETINEGNWAKGAFAFNRSGTAVGLDRSSAVRWCLMGHLQRARMGRKTKRAPVEEAIRLLFPDRATGITPIPNFNDHPKTTVEDVIRVCKLADV